jgi:spermidine synthase
VGGDMAPPASAGTGQTVFYLISTFLILGIPTGFMGATLPLLIKYTVRSDEEIGSRVSLLYAVNTTGAVAGALLAGFLVLPTFGLRQTIWLGAIINVFVLVIAFRIDQNTESALIPQKRTLESMSFKSQQSWILPIMAVSGAVAFTYEVLWTRLLNHVLGGSIYAFSTMLASFLAGIAIGSGISGRFATDGQKSTMYFAASQVLVAAASIAVFLWIEDMLPESAGMLGNAFFAMAVMLPSAIFIGATFPLAVRILSRNEFEAGTSAANIYAWNTIGAIVGALLAGFYVIPKLGFTGTVKAAVLTNLVLALVTTFLLPARRRSYSYFTAAAIVAALLLFNPVTPNAVIRSSALPVPDGAPEKQLFFEVGRSSTVLLVEQGGTFTLRTNGLPEAQIFARGAPPIRNTQKWLTALPVIARPDARTMLVIGFGGGVAIEGIPPSVTEVDVIELEPEVINANRLISNHRAVDPISMPGVNIIINDARNALKLTSRTYDVIVSQPSHPWTAGASHLFTREFFQLSKRHLDKKGVFVQWMNSELLDASLLRSLVATLFSVFDHVRLYHPDPGVLFFVASDAPVNIEQQLLASGGRSIAEYANHYGSLGLATVEDILLTLAADEAGLFKFSKSARLVTDNNNLMATESKVFGTGLTADELIELLAPYDPLLDRESWVFNDLENFDFAYMTSSMLRQKFNARVSSLKKLCRMRQRPC